MNLFTKENVTFFMALIAFVGTLAAWGYSYIKNRKNIQIHILSKHINFNQVRLLVSFENNSRLPISITRLSVLYNSKFFECSPIPEIVMERTSRSGSEVTSRNTYYSIQLPIIFEALAAYSGYFILNLTQEDLPFSANSLSFQVSTTRGKLKEKILEIPDDNIHPRF